MVDLALRLIDYLIAFTEQREKDEAAFFDRYVQPAYNAAEIVYRDYVGIFSGGRDVLSRGATLEEFIDYLTKSRDAQLPVRMQLRAVLDERLFAALGNEAGEFEDGIFRMLCAGMNFSDTGRYNTFPSAIGDLQSLSGQRPHTLLDYIRDMQAMADLPDRLTPDQIEQLGPDRLRRVRDWQGKAMTSLNRQIEALHSDWQRIVNGYVAYQKRTLPRSVRPRRD